MLFHWARLISMIKPQNIKKMDFSSLSHFANWQHAPVKIYSIFKRSLEILLEISRCLNYFPLLWIGMRDPFVWRSLLSSLTSPSYPLKPIKRASISLGRGSPFCIWNSLCTFEAWAKVAELLWAIVSHCWLVGKITPLHACELCGIDLGAREDPFEEKAWHQDLVVFVSLRI